MVLGGATAEKPSFKGDLAAVRLHDAAMTDEEIAHNFQGGVMLGTELHNWWRTEPDKWWVKESEHFRHCVDKEEMKKWSERQLKEFHDRVPRMFAMAELIYRTYSERLALRSSVVSVQPQERGDGIKYKTPIQPSKGSWMGWDGHFGWACQGAGHINPHELVHGWQAQTGGMAGSFWEAHANFPQTYNGIYQTLPPSCVSRVCMYFPAHGRAYYHDRLMFEHLAQTPEYGPMFVSKLWYDGPTESDSNPYPWIAFDRVLSNPRMPLADEYTRMVMRNVTWDYVTFAEAPPGQGNTPYGNDHAVSPVNSPAFEAVAKGEKAKSVLPDSKGSANKINHALVLNGKDQFVELPKDVADMGSCTYTAEFQWDGGGDGARVFEFANPNGDALWLSPSEKGHMVFAIRKGTAVEQVAVAKPLAKGEWASVQVILDGPRAILVVNGSKEAENTRMTLRPDSIRATQCYLGRGLGSGYFGGKIARFAVHSVPVVAEVRSTP